MDVVDKRKQDLRNLSSPSAAAQALGKAGYGCRGSDLHYLIQRTDIDAELQRNRRSGYELFLGIFHFVLRLLPQDRRNISVMDAVHIRSFIFQRKLAQMRKNGFRLFPGVCKNNRFLIERHFIKIFKMLRLAGVLRAALGIVLRFLKAFYK